MISDNATSGDLGYHRISLSVLGAYFSTVSTLQTYLGTILEDDGSCIHATLSTSEDSEQLVTLLNTTYVAIDSTPGQLRRFAPVQPVSLMREVSGVHS